MLSQLLLLEEIAKATLYLSPSVSIALIPILGYNKTDELARAMKL